MIYEAFLIFTNFSFGYFYNFASADAKPINQCLDISLEKPTRSFGTKTVGIRATNDCKDVVYFSYVVCSNDKIFSESGGTEDLYKKSSERNLIIPRSTTYKWSRAGGFTYIKNARAYNFRWKASYTPMGSLPKCKAPPSKSSKKSTKYKITLLHCIKLSGNYVINNCKMDLVVKAWTVGGGCLKRRAKTLKIIAKRRKYGGFKRGCGASNWNAYALGCPVDAYRENICNWDLIRKKHGLPRGALQKW